MSTKISAAYDAIVLAIQTALPGIQQIPNAYELERAGGLFIDFGFAVSIGTATNPKTELSCQLQLNRTFGVTLTRQCAATDNDASTRGSIEKQVAEDMLTLIQAFESSTALSSAASDVTFEGDSGIEFLRTEAADGAYYLMSGVFTITYFESLTA